MRRRGLTLESPSPVSLSGLALDSSTAHQRHGALSRGAASALRYHLAPWLAPVRRRYQSSNQPLMDLLDWATAKTWPLAFIDQQCRWIEEGSASSRLSLGTLVTAALAALLSLQWPPLFRLQAMTSLPIFDGHGLTLLLAASFLLGAILLPPILGRVLPVLLRLFVLLSLCIVAALLGYGLWLLFDSTKF